MSTHAEAIAKTLADRGVEYVFGLPGGEIVAFIDACRRAGLRFVLTGHEASAAWMAQVVGEIGGVPGVCAATLGPGATNLVTGVANAWLDRAPLLAVTAQIADGGRIPTMTHQRLALDRLFRPIAKFSFHIGQSDTAGLVHQCMDIAAEPRPGPVHLSLAGDVALQEYAPEDSPARANADEFPGSATPDHILALLQASARPLVLIGLGATPETAPWIRALIDKLQAPFLVTAKAKGIVSEDHPLFAGVASGMAIDHEIVETIRTADLILGIGFDPVECDKSWFADVDNLIAIDSASMRWGRYHPIEAIGDVSNLVVRLAGLIQQPKPWSADLLETRRKAIRRTPMECANGLSPLRLIEELRSILPRDGIATCDVGSHKLAMGQFWRAYEPGTFFMSNGLSGMGFGIPAAIAAQLMHPERPVMAVVGDGGMLMMLHDLTLIRELNLPIVIVVLVDRSLSLIRVSAERRGFPPHGMDFTPPDFARIAEAFGLSGRRAATVAEAKNAVEQALAERTALLLEVPIDRREYYALV